MRAIHLGQWQWHSIAALPLSPVNVGKEFVLAFLGPFLEIRDAYAQETYEHPSPISTNATGQRQRRISRTQLGVRVSRRLPARSSKGSVGSSKGSIQLDGAGSSIIQEPDSSDYPYWGTLHPPQASYRNSNIARHATGHVDEDQNNDGHHQCVPDPLGLEKEERKTPKQEKRFGLADPAAWDAINRSLTQQRRLSSFIAPDAPTDVQTGMYAGDSAGNLSRTSSQRRDLRHFTRELEKFVHAADAIGRLPVITPTVSDSRPSYHTVKPLVPYKSEFEAAGLAVTSGEQRHNSPHHESTLTSERPNKHLNISDQPLKAQEKLEGHDRNNSRGSGMSSYHIPDSRAQGTSSTIRRLAPSPIISPPPLKKRHKHSFQSSQRLLSSLLQRLSNKIVPGHEPNHPIRNSHVKNGQVQPENIPSPQDERNHLQRRSQKLRMQTIPEMEQETVRTQATDYITGKRGATVALSPMHDPHFQQHLSPRMGLSDAAQSLGKLQGTRDFTRALLPKPCLDPIATIEEETTFCPEPNAREANHSAPRHHEAKSEAALNSHPPRIEQCPWVDSSSSSSPSIHDDVKRQRPALAKQKGVSHTVFDSNKPKMENCPWVPSSSSSSPTPPYDAPGHAWASLKQKEKSLALVHKPKSKSSFHPRISIDSSSSHSPIGSSSSQSPPFAVKLAASRASSLQRVLDEAGRKLDEEEHLKDTVAETFQDNPTQNGTSHATLPSNPKRTSQHDMSQLGLPRLPRADERFIYVKRTMPPVSKCHADLTKPLPPEPIRGIPNAPRPKSVSRTPRPVRVGSGLSRKETRRDRSAVAELAKAEEMLQDLDVFLSDDHDDASIADRDVLKGLQVAIQAAADDLFDAYIRHKTGLRIRRFLADLKAFDEDQQAKATDQRARNQRAKQRRR
ncbi:hypothetical protein F5Y18DRAFT_426619 [Xylariaceae sp. FL1019]|nr:hypothetical protein F5Y18DRAFT_426619 [Xylariaceae sp. FL1019]